MIQIAFDEAAAAFVKKYPLHKHVVGLRNAWYVFCFMTTEETFHDVLITLDRIERYSGGMAWIEFEMPAVSGVVIGSRMTH